MLGSQVLEVTIGMVFIFVLVSTICSTLREGLEAWLKTRAAFLEHGIRQLLKGRKTDKDPDALTRQFYAHPMIAALFPGDYKPGKEADAPRHLASGHNLPSYIPSKNFAWTLMDIAARGPQTDEVSSDPSSPVISLQTIRTNIENIGNVKVQRALLMAIDAAQGDLNTAQKNIERWFDSAMDRVSGWYRRSTQWILFWIGLIVAVVLNINSIALIDYLYKNDAARKAAVAQAEQLVREKKNSTEMTYEQAKIALDKLDLPIGWSKGLAVFDNHEAVGSTRFANSIYLAILGWLITAIAVTLGAPFWFDLLNKIMVIRSTVKPHEKSPEEGSEDRQPKQPLAPVINLALPGGMQRAVAPAPAAPAEPVAMNWSGMPNVRDEDSGLDGCGVHSGTDTKDEDLPPAQGGVA